MAVKNRERVNMRLPDDLVRWARRYAREHDTTLTALVIRGLNLLWERDSRKRSTNADAAR